MARLIHLAPALLLVACADSSLRLDPAKSAAMADSAQEASTTPSPPLPSEEARKPPGSQVSPTDVRDLAINAALANPARPPADRARDIPRQSAAVLKFFGIAPGMTVLDLYSGGGYYTELVAALVGPSGKVVAHNNSPYLGFAREELAVRYAPGRLPNVQRLLAENNELKLPAGVFDAVLMTNVYHDIYFVDEKEGWARIDGPKMLAEVYQSMRPGAVLGVVDHVAADGAPPETGGTLHRIDPALLKREIIAAGFVFDGESDKLRNPLDDHSKSAFDPAIRSRTDQVILRFRKPR